MTPTANEPRSADVAEARRLETDALRGTGLSVPSETDIVDVRQERHDERTVTVIRHQDGGCQLGGPHTSLVLDEEGTILGYTRLDEPGGDPTLPDEADAQRIALDFLRQLDPEYAEGLRVEWVDQHDETVTLSHGDEVVVSGMKVKTHHDNGRYTWVVVGADGAIVTYEREITWDSGKGRRGTQMWLHDAWIAAHDGVGPQPGSPYALVKP